MDPVSQTLAQQQSGSAEGQGFGQFYLAGQQNRNERDRLNLATQHLKLQEKQESRLQKHDDLIDPIMAEYYKGQAAHLGIETKAKTLQYQTAVEYDAALPEIYQLQNDFLNSPLGHADPELRQRALYLSTIYPKAFAPGSPGSDIWTQMESTPYFKERMQRILDAENQFKGSGIVPSQFDKAGMPTGFTREQPTGAFSTIGKLQADMRAALERGDVTAAKELNEGIQGALVKDGLSITLPDGTKISQGGKQSSATNTALESTTNSTVTLLEAGNDLIQLAQDPNNVGIRGNLIRKYNQIAPNFGAPPVEGGKQFEFKANAMYYGQNVIRQLKSDGQIAQREVTRLEDAVSSGGWLESTKSVTDLTTRMNELLSLSQVLRLARNGQPIPSDLLQRLPSSMAVKAAREGAIDEEGIRSLYHAGKISEEEAVAIITERRKAKK